LSANKLTPAPRGSIPLQCQTKRQSRSPGHEQLHTQQRSDRPHRTRRPAGPDQPAQYQREKCIHEQPPRAVRPARPKICDHFEHRFRQQNARQKQRQAAQSSKGMCNKVKSAHDIHKSDQGLPDNAPNSASAERRNQMRYTAKNQQPAGQDRTARPATPGSIIANMPRRMNTTAKCNKPATRFLDEHSSATQSLGCTCSVI